MKHKFIRVYRNIVIFMAVFFMLAGSFGILLRVLDLDPSSIKYGLVYTIVSVLAVSIIICLADSIHYKLTVDRYVKEILECTDRLAAGDFKARVDFKESMIREPELELIADNINHMAEQLSSIETLKTDFVSNVSHELKTPLAVIGNYSTMLQDEAITADERKEYTKAISDTVKRLSNLISNILKLNKLENQKLTPQKKTFDLGEEFTECLLNFENIWEEKDIELDADIDDGVMIESDDELLSLIWNNLLSNAFKFTEPGGRVSVSVKDEQGCVRVSVADSGCGMDQETGKHIFDKFYQGDTSHAGKGNGLGLALVKRVVDLLGASISVSSELGKGTKFSVKLDKETTEVSR